MKLKLSVLLSLFLLIWLFPISAFACACCAEPGFYSIDTSKPSISQFEELRKLKFETAELYENAGYPDNIKGINPLGDKFSIQNAFGGKKWTFNFKDSNQKTGALDLAKPVSMVRYMVDLPSAVERNTEVSLYKEWRFKYKLQNASGIFKNAFTPDAEYFLILQGYGNACTSVEDFTKWRLEISGKKADFAFFGKLSVLKKS